MAAEGGEGAEVRVLHVVRRFVPLEGGTERYVHDLASAQARRGHEVRVVTLDRDCTGVVSGRLPRRGDLDGVHVERLRGTGGRRWAVTWDPLALIREIRRSEVVHIHDLRFMLGASAVAARELGRPLIVHTHGLVFHTTSLAWLKNLVFAAYYTPVLRLADAAIIAVSPSDAELVKVHATPLARRVRQLDAAIDLRPYRRVRRNPHPGALLYFGRIDANKGLDRLMDRLGELPGEWTLTVAGDGPRCHRTDLQHRAERLGIAERIRWSGRYTQGDLERLLGTAAAAVFPSRAEGFGLTLVEAMAAGVPVVASGISSYSRILGGGRFGTVVDFDTPDATVAIAEVLAGRGLVAAMPARSRAEDYAIEKLANRIDGLYADLGVRALDSSIHQRNRGSSHR